MSTGWEAAFFLKSIKFLVTNPEYVDIINILYPGDISETDDMKIDDHIQTDICTEDNHLLT